MRAVTSSNIASVGYDPAERAMQVQFKSGGLWRYTGVPQSVYDALLSAESIGKYFHGSVRTAFTASKVEPE